MGQWRSEESECTSHSQQKIKPLKIRWKAHVLRTLKISFEHWVRIVLKVEERPNSTRLSRWVIFSVSVSSLVCSSVLLSISPKHLHKYSKYNVSKRNLKVLLSSPRQASTYPLAYLPVHKLQYKILKFSTCRAQFSFHLQFSNAKEAQ